MQRGRAHGHRSLPSTAAAACAVAPDICAQLPPSSARPLHLKMADGEPSSSEPLLPMAAEAGEFKERIELATQLSWVVNWLLLFLKAAAFALSGSKAVLASLADSAGASELRWPWLQVCCGRCAWWSPQAAAASGRCRHYCPHGCCLRSLSGWLAIPGQCCRHR